MVRSSLSPSALNISRVTMSKVKTMKLEQVNTMKLEQVVELLGLRSRVEGWAQQWLDQEAWSVHSPKEWEFAGAQRNSG